MRSAIRRSKMVSIRLSPDEYREFQQMCESKGLRTISDLARTAMHRLVAAEHDADPLTYEVQDLRNQAHLILVELQRLLETVSVRNSAKA